MVKGSGVEARHELVACARGATGRPADTRPRVAGCGGKGERRIGVRQGPAVANGHVFAAAITGGVHAIDLQTGKKVWTWEPQKEKKKAKRGAGVKGTRK